MNANIILELSMTSISDLSYKYQFTKYVEAKIDINNACEKLKIAQPLTVENAIRLSKYLAKYDL